MINSSSGSCHDSDATWQEIGCMCGSACSCLIPVQGFRSLLSNMYCLYDPSSTFVRFSVQNSGGWPVDHVVIMWISRLDFPESQRADEDKNFKEETKKDSANRRLVILPYVEGTSERIAWVMRKHQVHVAMRPVKALKSLLVHPKDKQDKEETTDCVYKIPCASCEKSYI